MLVENNVLPVKDRQSGGCISSHWLFEKKLKHLKNYSKKV